MADELDTSESLNTDGELDTNLDESEATVEDLAKAKELANNQKIRAEKAERELKELKAKSEKPTPKNDETQSNEPDYAKMAFLEAKDVKHLEDQKLVMDEAKRLKLPLTDILGMEHIKSKLKDSKDQREAQDGAPRGKGKSGGNSAQDVEYHLAKGTTPDDLELAEKVIEARMKQEQGASKFSSDLYR